MSKKSSKSEGDKPVVIPKVTFEGSDKKHALELLFESEAAPVITSVGCMRIPETNRYVSFVMKTQGKEVVSIEVDEPNLRAIAEEASKIEFVNHFMSSEL